MTTLFKSKNGETVNFRVYINREEIYYFNNITAIWYNDKSGVYELLNINGRRCLFVKSDNMHILITD